MEPEAKRKKVYRPPPRRTSGAAENKNVGSTTTATTATTATTLMNRTVVEVNVNQRVQQARNFAVAQAQQDGCTANLKIFDSPFGNFLVPVVPSRAELGP